jgi:DNA-3-methyladenine glycosylase II
MARETTAERRARAHTHLVETAAAVSPALAAAMTRAGPLWFPRRRTRELALFLARCVVGQQLSGAAAGAIWARLEAALGGGPGLADRWVPAAVPAMRASGLSAAKSRALVAVREAGRGGLLDAALAAPDRERRDLRLREIRGVGQWTCDMVSIFYCREPDVWPRGDASVRRAFHSLLGTAAIGAEAHQAAFSPWRSILALHLYRHLDGPGV